MGCVQDGIASTTSSPSGVGYCPIDLLCSSLFTFFGIEDGGLEFAFGFFAPLREVDAAGLAALRFAVVDDVTEGVGVF